MCWMTGAFLKTEQLVTRCSRLQTGRTRRSLCKLHFYLMTSLSLLRTGCRSDQPGYRESLAKVENVMNAAVLYSETFNNFILNAKGENIF